MNNLSKNFRTHIVILRDGRKFNITQDQYQTLRLNKEDKKRTDMFILRDIDTKEVLFDGEYGDIKEFRERKTNTCNGYRYICSFGTRHPLNEECKCEDIFGCLSINFKDKLKEMGYDVFYDSDITQKMRNEYLKKYKKS